MKTVAKSVLIALCTAIVVCGCVPAPRQGDGRISLRVSWGTAERGLFRGLEEISAVNATLSRQSLKVVVPMTIEPAGGSASGTATGLYAGEWTLKVDAVKADGTVLYTGQTKVMVVSNEECHVVLSLRAVGTLDITMDISLLLEKGLEVPGGKIGIYEDPTSGSATYEDMAREGEGAAAVIHGIVNDLEAKTYDAKVVIPQATNAVFISKYFQFSIQPGRTTTVHLAADGHVVIDITILPEPGQVTGLLATPGPSAVTLNWNPVSGASGYRVYRTDGNGRFWQLEVIGGGGVTSYTDGTFGEADPYNGKVSYAVAALAGTIEGLRSDPVEVPVG